MILQAGLSGTRSRQLVNINATEARNRALFASVALVSGSDPRYVDHAYCN